MHPIPPFFLSPPIFQCIVSLHIIFLGICLLHCGATAVRAWGAPIPELAINCFSLSSDNM